MKVAQRNAPRRLEEDQRAGHQHSGVKAGVVGGKGRPLGHRDVPGRPNEAGEVGFKFMAGGGMGRTPILGSVIREFLPWQHLLTYTEAVMRVYNSYGRRDNKYKARIKILLKALGVEEFSRLV